MSYGKIIIIGAGPGGLTAGMLLAHRGFEVIIYEKAKVVGGRNAPIIKDGYVFDTGPTFLMMKFILDEVFEEAGANINDYINAYKLDPMYRLQFKDFSIDISDNKKKMVSEIRRLFPNEISGLEKFMKTESMRFKRFFPCLQKDYSSIKEYFKPVFIRALPYIFTTKSMMQVLDNYFNDDRLKICFTFQAKYLGMSPWSCPGQFMIIPYIEHAFGIYHVEGGLSEISFAMEKVFKKNNGKLKLNTPVKKIIIKDGKAIGVELKNGKKDYADNIIVNADFSYAITNLIDKNQWYNIKRWNPKKLKKKKYSCSTFMLYLGVDKLYDMPHHTIVFADNYKKNIDDVFLNKRLSDDISIYIRNASINDKKIAPKNHSAIYILVPVSNTDSNINWSKERKRFRDLVIETIKRKTIMKDIDKHIKTEIIVTPKDWENNNIYNGATFNLAHTIDQMLYLRPHNKFEDIENLWLVGGGTHPGSGLPTIYESGRITANMISKSYRIKFFTKNLEV
ncbi:MAG: phytoene desaturase [Candidatus Woesearchaeota archaeon]|nr:MAG: phytoene desaturase [Candidatus Woesearchaeota archaeon]